MAVCNRRIRVIDSIALHPNFLSEIKGILFDLDNTLLNSKKAVKQAFRKVMECLLAMNVSEKKAEAAIEIFEKGLLEFPEDPDRNYPVHKWRARMWGDAVAISAGLSRDSGQKIYDEWNNTRMDGMVFEKEVEEMLISLRKKYKLGLITNGVAQIQREKLDKCQAEKYCDVILIGEDEFAKPHPSIFHKACEKLNLMPKNCIMVGDYLETDIQGGINAELVATVWITKRQAANPIPKPTFIIDHVTRIPELLNYTPSKS